jgi:CubicO group peptidase (beta-lactamase class C family)
MGNIRQKSLFRAVRTSGLVLVGMLSWQGSASAQPDGGPSVSLATAVLEPFVERGEIAGAVVMVVDADEVLELDATGFADIASKRLMPQDALFWIASTSKPFAGTAVMMLVEEGKLSLDVPVSTYLPGFAPGVADNPADPANTTTHPASTPVTLRMLLSHTSGMYSGGPGDLPTEDANPLNERVAGYGRLLQFEPQAQFWYGNADINTAAYIVQVVSGMPYEQFLKTRLFDPLGMSETSFCPTSVQLQRLATAYNMTDAPGAALEPLQIPFLRYPLDDCANRYPIPGGGLFSTAHDLGRFMQMLLSGGELAGHRYLTQASIDEMTRNQLTEEQQKTVPGGGPPANISYGLGWGAGLDGSYFHPGTAMTDIRVDPTHRVATILLMQSTAPASFTARTELLNASDARYAGR